MNFMCGKRLHMQPTRIKTKKIVKSLSKLTLRGNILVL